MTFLIEVAQYIGLFVLGLALRAAFFVAIIAALVVVLVPLIYAFYGSRLLTYKAAGVAWFHGLQWRRSPSYTPGHLWLRQRAEILRVGLDGLAARLLRRVGQVILPVPGTHLLEGQPLVSFDAGGGQRVTLPAPFEGTVSAVNRRLAANPALSIRQPYGRGWLLEFAPCDDRFAALPRHARSRQWFDGEATRFAFALDQATGIAMADGGEPLGSENLLLGQTEFARLASEFLHASVTPVSVRPE